MRNRILYLSLSVLFCMFLAKSFAVKPVDSEKAKEAEKSYFAINGGKAIHIPNELQTIVKKRVGWIKELGVKWDRSDLWWHLVEPEKGKFDFSITDKVIKFNEENDIQIYPILCYGAKRWTDRTAPLNDEDINDYATYVFKTVDRYKSNFTYWSIWNEPNIQVFWKPSPDVDMYSRMLKAAYKAAKKADPNNIICAPVIAPIGQWDRKFVEGMYQRGCKDYFDLFDYHYYRHTPPELEVPNEIDEIKAIMHRYGDKKRMWISESGVSSNVKTKPGAYERQAALVVRNQILCIGCGIERFFYFDLQNWFDDPEQSWDSYLGLVQADDEKKPSFYAYKTMVKEVDLKKCIGRYPAFGKNVESVLFYDEKKDDFILVAWNSKDDEKSEIRISGKDNKLRIAGIYGEEKTLDSESKTFDVEVTNAPIYIHNVDPYIYLIEAGVKFDYNLIEISPGDSLGLTILKDSLINSPELKVKNVKSDNEIKWDSEKGLISCSDAAAPGTKSLEVELEISYKDKDGKNHTAQLKKQAKIKILEEFTVSVKPYLDGDKLMADAVINNLSRHDFTGNLKITEIIDNKTKVLVEKNNISAKANETLHVDLEISKDSLKNYSGSVDWVLEFDKFKSKPYLVYSALLAENKPIIDGKLDEWKNIPEFDINRKDMITRGKEGWTSEEASATVKIWFTKDMVYIGADVKDDDPLFNKHKNTELWKGDSLEIYLGFDGPVKRTALNKEFEFQIALAGTYNEEKPIIFQYHKDKEIPGSTIEVTKKAGGYLLEAGIPLTELGSPKITEGKLIGFDFAVDDLDKDDWAPADVVPGRALMWGGENMNWIDPSGWSMAIIKIKPAR